MRPKVISVSSAKNYYYEKDAMHNIDGKQGNTLWYGSGCSAMGLEGNIRNEHLERVISGQHAQTGEQLIEYTERIDPATGEMTEARAGVDIPFTPPKDFSLLMYHNGTPEIRDTCEKIMWDAAKASVTEVDREFTFYRQSQDGERTAEKGSLITAMFMHSTNRENEYNSHIHCIFSNIVGTQDGGWKALFNDFIFEHQRYINSGFQAEVAKLTQERLGIAIQSDASGKWRIVGSNEKQNEAHAKRTAAINAKVDELLQDKDFQAKYPGMSDVQLREMAVLASRPAKDRSITEAGLKAQAEGADAELGIDKEQVLLGILQHKDEQALCPYNATELIEKAAEMCHESESTFSRVDVLSKARILGRGTCGIEDLNKAYEQVMKKGDIAQLDGGETHFEDIYSTRGMIEIEAGVVKAVQAGKGQMQPIVDTERVVAEIERFEGENGFKMTSGQKAATAFVLTSTDRFIAIQGDPGTGKTTSFKLVKQVLDTEGYGVVGVSKVGKAVGGIKAQGIEAFTLDSFLADDGKGTKDVQDYMKTLEGKPLVLLMDESSLTGSKLFWKAVDWAVRNNARIVFVGDTKQLKAVEGGDLFERLQSLGLIDTVHMTENVRQQEKGYKEAIDAMKDQTISVERRVEDSFALLQSQGRIVEIKYGSVSEQDEAKGKTHLDRLRGELVKNYLTTDYHETSAYCPLNETRRKINEDLHTALLERGDLTAKSKRTVEIREDKRLGEVEKCFAQSYEKGDIVNVRGKLEGQGEKAGNEWEVMGVHQSKNTVNLISRKDASILEVELKANGSKLSAYKARDIEIAEGEKILYTKGDKGRGVKNGTIGFIEKIGADGQLTVKLETGKTLRHTTDQMPYYEQGYAITIMKAQGQNDGYEHLFVPAGTPVSDVVNSYQNGLVGSSRGKKGITVYTDLLRGCEDGNGKQKNGLIDQVKREAVKASTLDFKMPASPIDTKPLHEAVEKYTEAKETKQGKGMEVKKGSAEEMILRMIEQRGGRFAGVKIAQSRTFNTKSAGIGAAQKGNAIGNGKSQYKPQQEQSVGKAL